MQKWSGQITRSITRSLPLLPDIKCFKAEPIKERNNKDNHANASVPQRFKLTQNSLLATCNWYVALRKGILGFGIQNSRLSYKGRAALLKSFVSSATENSMRSKFSLSLTILIQFLPFLIATFKAVIVLMAKIRSPLEQKWLISHPKASVALSPGTVLRCSQMIMLSLDSSSWKLISALDNLEEIAQWPITKAETQLERFKLHTEEEKRKSYINIYSMLLLSLIMIDSIDDNSCDTMTYVSSSLLSFNAVNFSQGANVFFWGVVPGVWKCSQVNSLET